MFTKKLLPLVAIFAMFSGCGADNPFENPSEDCNLPAPEITTNSPVTAGTDIVLETPYVNNGIYYWTGPNDYVSHEQNPIINIASLEMAGTYSLSIGNEIDGCITPTSTTTIDILSAVAPCAPANNTATTSVFPNMTFGSVYEYVYNDDFQIVANGSNGDMKIYFKDAAQPTAGVYTICPDCPTTFLEANQVCVSIVTGGTFSEYYVAQSGDVYISYIDGKISATFCSLPFSGGSMGINFTATAKVTD